MTDGRPPGPGLPRRLAAEACGTFALVFVAAGADAMSRVTQGDVSTAARAVAPGLLVGALIYAIADVSGAHFNPVVTLAFTLKGLFPASWVPRYWAAQAVGAIAAALLLWSLFGDAVTAGVSTPHQVTATTALVLEVVLTALLVTVVLGTADRARVIGPNAALAVGATIALCGLIALPVEGASMNPARSLGPALVTGHLGDLWLYVVGPTAGAIVAALLARILHGDGADDSKDQEAAQGGGR
ncbi:MAG TPA: aquaporin [Candidatus Limnocylindrales bacterium]